jgi:leucyl-tRNA---protein transferase
MTDQAYQFPRFFVTAPSPCPYLPGRQERKVFTELSGLDSADLNEALGRVGFRRSQNVAYRPSCSGCSACVSVRVIAPSFVPNGSMRRLLRRNADLHSAPCEPWATEEQFALMHRYLHSRHPEGGMASMDFDDYSDMVERTPVNTSIIEYREPPCSKHALGKLVGVCLSDVLSDGFSMVYSFFDVDSPRQGLGTYIILDHIRRAVETGRRYVYLGYWIAESPRMAYKTRFQPLEKLGPDGWSVLRD